MPKRREQEESEEEAEEYEVESIISAKAKKRGRKLTWSYYVKWKGYNDPKDNTWEPEESFDGSADEIVNKFWERVNLGGRKRNVAADFNHDEQFHPTGPPLRRKKSAPKLQEEPSPPTKSVKPTPTPTRKNETTAAASPSVEPARRKTGRARKRDPSPDSSEVEVIEDSGPSSPRKSSRKRSRSSKNAANDSVDQIVEPTPKKARRAAEKTATEPEISSSRNRGRLSRADKSSKSGAEVADEGEEITQQTAEGDDLFGPDDDVPMPAEAPTTSDMEIVPDSTSPTPPVPALPAHRARAANPRVKLLDPEEIQVSLNGAISTKARAVTGNGRTTATNNAAAGPSVPRTDSSQSPPRKFGPPKRKLPNRKDSLLTFEKGGLKTLKRVPKAAEPMQEDPVEAPESGKLPEMFDTSLFGSDEESGQPGTSAQAQPKPTGKDLLALAGHNEADANDLPDFDEEPAPVVAAEPAPIQEKPAAPVVVTRPDMFAGFKRPSSSMFSPLTMGGSYFSPRDDQTDASLAPFHVFLAPQVSMPIEPKDVHPATRNDGETIDAIMQDIRRKGDKSPPGKFYTQELSLSIVDTLEKAKSHARVTLHESANDGHRAMFQSFSARLSQGGAIATASMPHVGLMLYYAATNKHLVEKLDVPVALRGLVDTVLVSYLHMQDFMKYADLATMYEDVRW